MKLVLIALIAALMFGCSGNEGADCESVNHDGAVYCVYQGAITETGYDCPAEFSNLHHDPETELAVCSNNQEPPPFDELEDVLEEPPSSNEPEPTLPDETGQCIEEHADGTMLSDVEGGCDYGYSGPCEQVDREAETRDACRAEGGDGCDEPYITREAALCITRAAGLEAGEWPETASLVFNVEEGPIWAVSVLREVVDDGVEGSGDVWFVDARTGEIVEKSGFSWIN